MHYHGFIWGHQPPGHSAPEDLHAILYGRNWAVGWVMAHLKPWDRSTANWRAWDEVLRALDSGHQVLSIPQALHANGVAIVPCQEESCSRKDVEQKAHRALCHKV